MGIISSGQDLRSLIIDELVLAINFNVIIPGRREAYTVKPKTSKLRQSIREVQKKIGGPEDDRLGRSLDDFDPAPDSAAPMPHPGENADLL
jgi:hypothetical protein